MDRRDKVKMVAFDLDGTLCDSIPMCIEAFREAVSPYAHREITTQDVMETFGLNEVGMIKAVVPRHWEQALNDFYRSYEALHFKCSELFPGIREWIGFLKAKGVIVVLITGKGEKSCRITLDRLGLSDTFADIATGSEQRPNKTQSILRLMDKYEVTADEFYYVGDAASDVRACGEAGVVCLSAAWADSCDAQTLRAINSPHVFATVGELERFFSKNIRR